MDIKTLRHRLDQQKGMKAQIEHTIRETISTIRGKGRDLTRHEQALTIIREVGLKTQQQLEVHISDITTLAQEAIFDDPYGVVVEFVQRRNSNYRPDRSLLDFTKTRTFYNGTPKPIRHMHTHCRDCKEPLKLNASKIYGICPSCDNQ